MMVAVVLVRMFWQCDDEGWDQLLPAVELSQHDCGSGFNVANFDDHEVAQAMEVALMLKCEWVTKLPSSFCSTSTSGDSDLSTSLPSCLRFGVEGEH